jgi:nanoRNase/pAp phosphatase (c-di-AMP/oligoRNAs hydrolase)
VDFAYPKEVLEQLQSVHKSVTVLDHHKTAQGWLEGVKGCHFDMTKSGCVLAWEFFHPDKPVPELLLDIQDRDLWKFERPNSKAVHAGLALLNGNMHAWDQIIYSELVASGNTLLRRQDQAVESHVKHKVKVIDFQGYKVGITNSSEYASEIGNGICNATDLYQINFAAIYVITNRDSVLFSLRSVGEMDVAKVAEKFGGGGHKNAAGFQTSLDVLTEIIKGSI